MIEDVFSFDDFLSKNGSKKPKSTLSLREKLVENEENTDFIDSDKEEDIVNIVPDLADCADCGNEFILNKSEDVRNEKGQFICPDCINTADMEQTESEEESRLDMRSPFEEIEEETYHSTNESAFVNNDEDDDYYKLYQDKNEEFCCDIMIEGSSPEETYARIIIESENWSLVFPGEIRNGKCIVPIKKLNILKEGEIGNIKLEVVAEGNLFTPWENQFKVKMSKKVTVMMNENKKQQKKPIINNKIGVKVNVK
jgi:hypothetical protein